MRVTRLEIAHFRRFQRVSLAPGPALNLLTGDNGAGKTSVLEALHLMAYGRSFRGRVRDGLIATGAGAVEVFVEWEETASARTRRAGMRHGGQAWEGRLDGANVAHLGELCAALAVVTFEPGSHVLVTGGGEPRRRLLEWRLFHVEPMFLPLWRRYARALRQLNALLKARARDAELDAGLVVDPDEQAQRVLAERGKLLDGHQRMPERVPVPQRERHRDQNGDPDCFRNKVEV